MAIPIQPYPRGGGGNHHELYLSTHSFLATVGHAPLQVLKYSRRLEGGLLALQQMSIMLVFTGIYGGNGVIQARKPFYILLHNCQICMTRCFLMQRIGDKLALDGLSLESVQNILRETASKLKVVFFFFQIFK